ncbi:MAG: MBL fold metallo-hydrolase [Bdellovibrionaceae bacterium]|nr:MBL fold metallo-hydrolase [Pseudobdellovibrionaceae bacterium]
MSILKIHHLNCGTMCPAGGYLFPKLFPKRAICHCLLIETRSRLVLIDSGLGLQDIARPERLGVMGPLLNFTLDPDATAYRQVKKLGYSPLDVTDLIPTHLDLDHAGGIPDFRWAQVHVAEEELRAARSRSNLKTRFRYRPHHIPIDARWKTYALHGGEAWNGFACVRDLPGLPPEILVVNLPGHTPGHFGVAIQESEGWLLHAGDAYYSRDELKSKSPPSAAADLYRHFAHIDSKQTAATQARLADLLESRADLRMISSHDPREFRHADSGHA